MRCRVRESTRSSTQVSLVPDSGVDSHLSAGEPSNLTTQHSTLNRWRQCTRHHANMVYDPFRCVFESQIAQICGQIDFKSQSAFGICNKNTFISAERLERRNGIGHRGLWSGIQPLPLRGQTSPSPGPPYHPMHMLLSGRIVFLFFL